ncbi:MAG: formate dehydrogenase accessory sulfurtransferase FdhD [Bacteroidota bacterium]|jgi:FdhD protein
MGCGEGWCYKDGGWAQVRDTLASEIAFRISISDQPFTITMHSPGNEVELVHGLLFTEGLITPADIPLRFETEPTDAAGCLTGINVLSVSGLRDNPLSSMRNLSSVSSCGLCGKTELGDFPSAPFHQQGVEIDPDVIPGLFSTMQQHQRDFAASGGTHAAAAFDQNGKLLSLKEDIGRHNAVDKVVGHLLLAGEIERAVILCVSGRISYEIVSKTAAAGIPVLASVSAPSDLAVSTAMEHGMTVLAFCRQNKFTVYANPGRLRGLAAQTIN